MSAQFELTVQQMVTETGLSEDQVRAKLADATIAEGMKKANEGWISKKWGNLNMAYEAASNHLGIGEIALVGAGVLLATELLGVTNLTPLSRR